MFGNSTTTESITKRPREDADKDENPRETKRPSPPPDQNAQESQPSGSSSAGGFLAFASNSSPFAKVKGPNLFAKSSAISSPWSSGTSSPSPSTPTATTTTTTTMKKTGFEAFASPSSPFGRSKSPGAFGRSKSPKPTSAGVTKNSNAFSAYTNNGAQGFSAVRSAAGKRTKVADEAEDNGKRKQDSVDGGSPAPALGAKSDEEEGSEEREKMSFGDRLRAEKDGQGSGDDDEKVVLTEQECEFVYALDIEWGLMCGCSAYGRGR